MPAQPAGLCPTRLAEQCIAGHMLRCPSHLQAVVCCVPGFVLLQVLAHMPLSLHSMEVVNKLAASGCLPADMVHTYISNCINSCDDVPVS